MVAGVRDNLQISDHGSVETHFAAYFSVDPESGARINLPVF
jgi:hypothetical protein